MPYRHLIRQLADGTTEWASFQRDGGLLEGPSPGLPVQPADEVVLLLAAEQVLLLEAPRVARSREQLARALPFAIEDQIAGPVETLQVAFAEVAGARLPLAVTDREALQQTLQQLRAAAIEVDRCYAESQCLPLPAQGCVVWYDQGRVLLRAGGQRALCLQAGQELQLQPWLAAQGFALDGAERWASPGVEVAGAARLTLPPLHWLQLGLPGAEQPNLLQGALAPRRRQAASRGHWRWAAGLAAAALLAGFAHAALEARALRQHVEQRRGQMEALLRQTLPELQRVVDPLAQMRAAVGTSARRSADALGLLGRLAPLLAGTTRITLEALEYRAGALELTVVAADVATLDGLREQVVSLGGLQAELTSAVPGTRGVEGRLRVREGSR